MTSTWAANTSQGRMVGDHISTSHGSDHLADGVLFGGSGGTNAGSLWNVVDNNGSTHRD